LFADDARLAEAAPAAQALLVLARAVNLTKAAANLERYTEDVERRLLALFERSASKSDTVGMARHAEVLHAFNGGGSLMQRWIATRPMFLRPPGDELAPATTSSAAEDGEVSTTEVLAEAAARIRALAGLYREVQTTCAEEAKAIQDIFPNAAAVVAQLVQRVMEQRVQGMIEALLPGMAPSPAGGRAGILRLLSYLHTFANAYERTLELARTLERCSAPAPLALDVVAETDSLFSAHLEGYVEAEKALLTARAEESLATTDAFDPNDLLVWHDEAMARARTVLQTADVSSRGDAIAELSSDLVAHLSKAFKADLSAALAQSDAAADAGTSSALETVESRMKSPLAAVARCGRHLRLLERHLREKVASQLSAAPDAAAALKAGAMDHIGHVETAASQALSRAFRNVLGAVESALARQAKGDFTADEISPTHRPTAACERAVALAAALARVAASSLEGANLRNLVAEFANGFFAAVDTHLRRLAFSPAGAMRLKRDLGEYESTVRAMASPPVPACARFERLGALANLLMVPRESFAALVDTLGVKPLDADAFSRMRSDSI